MTIEPGDPDKPAERGAHPKPGVAKVAERLESGVPSIRILYVLVPVLAVVAGGMSLMGLWTLPFQPAPREKTVESPRAEDKRDGGNRTTAFDSDRFKPAIPDFGPSDKGERQPSEAETFDPKRVAALVANGDIAEGERIFRMCAVCHTGAKDAPHRLGSNLWGMFDRPVASLPDFRYSNALRIKGGTWTDESLAEYLHNPRQFAPGTSMAFAGIKDNARIANLIAYLRTLSDRPAPSPK